MVRILLMSKHVCAYEKENRVCYKYYDCYICNDFTDIDKIFMHKQWINNEVVLLLKIREWICTFFTYYI